MYWMNGSNPERTLLLAIGNSGRQDDGLGWAFGEALERTGLFRGTVRYRYQLQVEDAALVSTFDHVIFVDACREPLANGFDWRPQPPAPVFHFTTHALPPGAVLFLCQSLYEHLPKAHCLLVEGRAWELATGLTPPAREHLDRALRFFLALVQPGQATS
jgi:hydrogenase maturation protease